MSPTAPGNNDNRDDESTFQSALDRLVGQVLTDRYRLLRLLGKGGMSSVFLAEHVTITRQVAIKVLSPTLASHKEHIQRFLQEAQSASAIRHRNVVEIIDFGHTDDRLPFFVMEYLQGEDLGSMLDREGVLSWPRAKPLVMQICAALDAAHQRGVIHRDIKADNCFLQLDDDQQMRVKVLDFGLAKVSSNALDDTSLTASGAILGTADYMSPELAQSLPVDLRTDIYSLGVLIFRMVTGRLPFREKGWVNTLNAHVFSRPPSLSGVAPSAGIPPALETAVLRALAKSPDDRFGSIAEFAAALRAVPATAAETVAHAAHTVEYASAPSGREQSQTAHSPRRRAPSHFELAPTDPERVNPWLAPTAPIPNLAAPTADTQPGAPETHGDSGLSEAPAERTASVDSPRARARGARKWLLVLGALALLAGSLLAWSMWPKPADQATIDDELLSSFAPVPTAETSAANPLTADKLALGRMLFYEPRLSRNHDISCNSCHDLQRYGVDGRRFSMGHARVQSKRNSPSVYHAAGQFAQFWDGRVASIEEQAVMPIQNPDEMAMSDDTALAVLRSIPDYVARFARAFPDAPEPITWDHVGMALAAFERQLVTLARWDSFLMGERDTLSDQEMRGFNLFVYTGCVTCHFGPYVGGTMFQKLGLIKPWPENKDRGRFEVTKNDADWMVFKVPSLRNVTRTGPYFHDGSISSLSEAVRRMAYHQLGKELTDAEIADIIAWLGTLEGQIPTEYIAPPPLPPSTPDTPAPNPM